MTNRRLPRVLLALAVAACVVVPASVAAFGGGASAPELGDARQAGHGRRRRRGRAPGSSAASAGCTRSTAPAGASSRSPTAGRTTTSPATASPARRSSCRPSRRASSTSRSRTARSSSTASSRCASATQLASGLANLPATRAPSPRRAGCCRTTRSASTPRASSSIRAASLPRPPRGSGDTALWLADEYRPSIVRLTGNGELLARIVPKGATGDAYAAAVAQAQADSGNGIDVRQRASRRSSATDSARTAASRTSRSSASEGRTYLYTALQSPMENPGRADARLARDPRLPHRRDERAQPGRRPRVAAPAGGQAGQEVTARRQGLGAVAGRPGQAADRGARRHGLERPERASTRIWKVDFTRATNLLGGAYDSTRPRARRSRSSTSRRRAASCRATRPGVVPGAKALCIDVNAALTAGGLVNVEARGHVARQAGRQARARGRSTTTTSTWRTSPIRRRTRTVAGDDDRLRAAAGRLLVGAATSRSRARRRARALAHRHEPGGAGLRAEARGVELVLGHEDRLAGAHEGLQAVALVVLEALLVERPVEVGLERARPGRGRS